MELKKTFIAGKMNKDLDERLVPDGEFIDALNVTIDTTSGSNIGAVSNSLGNTLVTNIQQLIEDEGLVYVGSNAKTIGAVTYEADNLIYWLVTSDNFDAIFEYSELFQLTSIVLLCSKPGSPLNFNKNYPVTGINFIPASRDEGPFIYWTDGLNPPRRINVARAKGYTTDDPQIANDIDVILRPPLYSPKIDLSFNASIDVSNNIQDKFIYFSYRFKYKDNQYSSLAPFSSVAFHASVFEYDYSTGDNKGMLNKYNQVNITFDTGSEFVDEIQVLYFDTYKLNVYIVDNYNKSDISISDNSKYTITFSANKIYTPIESSEVTRLFDNVPLSAKAQEIIGNRLVYGNYVQFRDIVNSSGVKIIPDYILSLETEIVTSEPKKTFRSDRDYEIGIVYLDEYGRMTTALTSKDNFIYIPSINSDTANSIKVTLNNEPPFWATNYRFVIKQAQGDYYNIIPRTFFIDGVFRYFLINESDRDKITVGDYIIFKTSSSTATHVNTRFKILELEYKQASFVSTAPEGLYFKIKTDGSYFLNDGYTYTAYDISTGRGPRTGIGGETPNPVGLKPITTVNNKPVFYDVSGDNTIESTYPSLLAINNPTSVANTDSRIAIRILSTNSYEYTRDIDLPTATWTGPITIPSTLSDTLTFGTVGTSNYVNLGIIWDASTGYTTGDVFIFNVRGYNTPAGTTGYIGTPLFPGTNNGLYNNNYVIDMNRADYGGAALVNFNSPIYPFAEITIKIVRDGNPGSTTRQYTNTWTNGVNYYKNIEEWFWASGAYSTFDQYDQSLTLVGGADYVTFRNGGFFSSTGTPGNSNYMYQTSDNTGTLYMVIRGFGAGSGIPSYIRNEITVELTIKQSEGRPKLSAETVPLVSDIDVFYEMRKTYRIENNNHMVSWPYADFTDGGVVFPTVPEALGLTVLGPLDPNNPISTDLMHSFNIGERIWVQSSDTTPPIIGPVSGYYDIVWVTDYAIVINLPFPGTGTITPGKVFYKSWETDQDFNGSPVVPLVIELNNVTSDNSDFNAFAFGNGIESYRIYDNFLRPTMKYSPRATSIIEDYKQEQKISSLCYSGIYKGDTSTNRLNSFNLSQANFKNLDKQYGPIQKLYALDTNLMVLQQDKITSVLYGKNLLVDAVGGGQVASIPEVLGNQIVHPSEYGISNNPESFAKFSNMVFFTDARRGAVLQMVGDQVSEISANGMKNYFRDELKDNPNTQKLGMYDPYNETYVLAFTDVKQGTCELSISRDIYTIAWNTNAFQFFYMFSIMSSTFWTVTLEDTGDGTGWLNLNVPSGYGDQDIKAQIDENDSVNSRSVDFVVEYCDGETITFTLTQEGNGSPGEEEF